MKYREKLLELIFDDDENAMMEWITAQPIIDQPNIFRALKELSEEAAAENGDDVNEIVKGFDTFDEKINLYEEAVLDEKLAEATYVMALEEQEKAMQEMDKTTIGIREYVMDCVVNNEENADAMRELAKKIMQLEKDSGTYDAKNWIRIL